jgi:hypothetical protein
MSIYIYKNNQQIGPFEENRVLEMLQNKLLSPDDLGRRDELSAWQKLSAIFPNEVPVKKRKVSVGAILAIFTLIGFIGFIYYFSVEESKQREAAIAIEKQKNKDKAEKVRDFVTKYSDLIILSPPEKLAPAPYLNGKTIFVGNLKKEPRFWGYDYSFYGLNRDNQLSEAEQRKIWKHFGSIELKEADGFSKDINNLFSQSLAESVAEANTVVQLSFNETEKKQEYGNLLGKTLHGIRCDIVVIDKTIPAVIAKKSFINNNLPKEVQVIYRKGEVFGTLENPAQMYPFEEVLNYLKTFEKR